jgi:Bacteriophage HK97-gp10, putative tail-component
MFTFDTAAFEAALVQGAQQLVSGAKLQGAAHAGAEVLSGGIVTNVVAMHIVKTGRYRDSWEAVDVQASPVQAEAAAQSDVEYAQVLEYGSYRMAARPAVRTAVDSPAVHDDVLQAMAGEL